MPQAPVLIVIFFAFMISVLFCPLFIRLLRRLQYGQHIREDGPRRHLAKAGTPTMGGVVFLLAALASLLLLAPRTPLLWPALLLTFGNGAIGWLDDYAKVSKARSLGLKARNKIAGQAIIALVFTWAIYRLGYTAEVAVPFTGLTIDLGVLYPVLVFVIILGFTNGVNLTDGLDGLATGTAIIALLAFMFVAVSRGLHEVALFNGALVGGCFGFLVFNLHPARVIMGDVGALALGGALAAAAVLTKTELFLLIIGGVFVIEAFSVIGQVISFQLTGRRIFLMAPLHHHFELKGWSEWQVVTGFWGLAFLLAIIGLVALGPGLF